MVNKNAGDVLFEYLYVQDALEEPAELIMGFGHFDPKIPRQCCELYRQGYAPRILFTGGIGAGTADIGMAEGLYFRKVARRLYPDIPDAAILVEHTSTHTGENVVYSKQMLVQAGLLTHLNSVILVANAYRQRRVWLTCRKHLPGVQLINAPPPTTLEAERAMFAEKGQELDKLLLGEIERIVKYGKLGYIQSEPLPPHIEALRA